MWDNTYFNHKSVLNYIRVTWGKKHNRYGVGKETCAALYAE